MKSIRTYQREIARLKYVIWNMHWVQPTYNGNPSCAFCGNPKHRGCAADCQAAKITNDYGKVEP